MIAANGTPARTVIEKSAANLARTQAVNASLKFTSRGCQTDTRHVKYLNNILEEDHRFINRITRSRMGFKAFYPTDVTSAVAHLIRKGQMLSNEPPRISGVFGTYRIIMSKG